MEVVVIAGHQFIYGRCDCGLAWLDIRNTRQSDVGEEGIAHRGRLTEHEYEEIEAVRAEEDGRIANAMNLVGKSRG